MKRFLALFVLLCLCLSFVGCKPLDYTKAAKLYNEGQFAQAQEMFTALDGYADSDTMAYLSWQKADYEAAEKAFAAGDYRQAMTLFFGLEMYSDSPKKAIESQYALGVSLIDAGEYEEAIDFLLDLGAYKDSAYHAHRAMQLWLKENLVQLGGVCLNLDEAGQQKLLLVSTGGETIDIIYTQESLLLGLPNSSRFVLTIYPETQTAAYEASYLSTAASTILEEASGLVDPAIYQVGQGLETYYFTQTITERDGSVSVSTDKADAIILQTLLPEATQIIMQNFSRLLELSETDITPQQLGFLSLN